MKNNAIVRIILWSLVIVILLGILFAGLGLYLPIFHRREAVVEATMAMLSPDEASVIRNCTGTATEKVNIRKSPSLTSEAIGVLEAGEPVQILRTETINGKEWGFIPDLEGWVVMEYVKVDEAVSGESAYAFGNGASATVTQDIAQNVNIRSEPSMMSGVLGQLEPGEKIRVERTETVDGHEWAYITEPKEGWVIMEVIDIGTPAPQSDNSAHFSTDEVSRISIDWVSGKITVEPADVTDIIILDETPDSKYPTVMKLQNGKLAIDFCKDNSITGWGFSMNLGMRLRKDLTIQVPRDFSLKELELDAASTNLEVHDLTIGEVDINTASGASTFLNCAVDKLDVDTASGDVIFKGSLDTLKFDAASANFTGVFSNVPSRMDIDSASGDLDVTLPPEAGFSVKLDGMSTDFTSEFDTVNRNGSYVHGDGACRIEMDAMSGDITIRMGAATVPESPTVPTAPEAPTAPTVPEAPTVPGAIHHTEPETHHPENGQHS